MQWPVAGDDAEAALRNLRKRVGPRYGGRKVVAWRVQPIRDCSGYWMGTIQLEPHFATSECFDFSGPGHYLTLPMTYEVRSLSDIELPANETPNPIIAAAAAARAAAEAAKAAERTTLPEKAAELLDDLDDDGTLDDLYLDTTCGRLAKNACMLFLGVVLPIAFTIRVGIYLYSLATNL